MSSLYTSCSDRLWSHFFSLRAVNGFERSADSALEGAGVLLFGIVFLPALVDVAEPVAGLAAAFLLHACL